MVKEVTYEFDDSMSENQVGGHTLTAKVQVAITEAESFINVGLFIDIKGRRLGLVEDINVSHADFDLSRGDTRVLRPFRSTGNSTSDRKNPFVANGVSQTIRIGILSGVEDDLDESPTVSQIKEDKSTMVPSAIDPTSQPDLLADVGSKQFSTLMCFKHLTRSRRGNYILYAAERSSYQNHSTRK